MIEVQFEEPITNCLCHSIAVVAANVLATAEVSCVHCLCELAKPLTRECPFPSAGHHPGRGTIRPERQELWPDSLSACQSGAQAFKPGAMLYRRSD
jgi:hypothetical protein